MIEKLTLFELHLDDARFSNAVGGTPEEAAAMLDELDATGVDADELDATGVDADELDATGVDDVSVDGLASPERSVGRTLGGLAVLVALAVGVRTVARRMLAADDETVADDADEDSVAVDLDDHAEV